MNIILITGSPYNEVVDPNDTIVYDTNYREDYNYSGNGAGSFLSMYNADKFVFVQ